MPGSRGRQRAVLNQKWLKLIMAPAEQRCLSSAISPMRLLVRQLLEEVQLIAAAQEVLLKVVP